MTRNIFIFLGTFAVGALIALVTRAAAFKPHAGHEGHPASGGDYAPMVTNPLTPVTEKSTAAPTSTKTGHDNHAASSQLQTPNSKLQTVSVSSPASASSPPVNTVCAICGMKVDPNLPTMEYQGKTIGFGCKLCAPKVKADPDRYGPYYLRNEVIKR
jgi:hypothetical protein